MNSMYFSDTYSESGGFLIHRLSQIAKQFIQDLFLKGFYEKYILSFLPSALFIERDRPLAG